jgi:hypothetical protein
MWLRELKEMIKRFYTDVNAKTLKNVEEIATAIAILYNAHTEPKPWRHSTWLAHPTSTEKRLIIF